MSNKLIFIYGAGEAGLSTLISLKLYKKDINVKGFIDDDSNKIGTEFNSLRVYSFDQFKNLDSLNSKLEIILSSEFITKSKREQLLDFCNKNQISVKKVPRYKDWINENEFSVDKIKKLQISDLLERDEITIDNKKIESNLKGKKILVTGGAGSIGSQIVKSIIEYNPKQIIVIDFNENALHDLELFITDSNKISLKKIEFITLDIKDRKSLSHLFEKFNPEIVFHAAAYKHVPMMEKNPLSAVSNNIIGTFNLLENTYRFSTKKFIYISTDKAINPTNIMGASKRYSECLVQYFVSKNKKTEYVTTRFGNVLGSNGSVIPRFQYLIDNGQDITVTHPDIIRYFMTIEEACNLVLEASTMAKNGEIFVFEMGEPCKISDLALKMIKLNGLELGVDINIKYTGLRPGEKLMEELLANSDNTLKTHHPKILIAKPSTENLNTFYDKLVELENATKNNNSTEAVQILKKCIPEYKSQNSKFSTLDFD